MVAVGIGRKAGLGDYRLPVFHLVSPAAMEVAQLSSSHVRSEDREARSSLSKRADRHPLEPRHQG